jgi:hypothetical protein
MMGKYQRQPYNGTLREAGRVDQTIVGEDWLSAGRRWNELRFLAAYR